MKRAAPAAASQPEPKRQVPGAHTELQQKGNAAYKAGELMCDGQSNLSSEAVAAFCKDIEALVKVCVCVCVWDIEALVKVNVF